MSRYIASLNFTLDRPSSVQRGDVTRRADDVTWQCNDVTTVRGSSRAFDGSLGVLLFAVRCRTAN